MKKKLVCLLMCIAFVFYAFSITTIASDFVTEKNYIESIAVDYITKYVNNAYSK